MILITLDWISAAIAASAVAGQAGITAGKNAKARRFAKAQGGRDRAYGWKMWEATNNYNRPSEQMKRFKAAGLNPNLIYGQGSGGNASQGGTPQEPTPVQEQIDLSGVAPAIDQFYDVDIKKATADNLKEQNKVIQAEQLLKAAQTEQTLTNTEDTEFNLGFKQDLRSVNAQFRKEQLRTEMLGQKGKLQQISASKTQQRLSIIKNTRDAKLAVSKILNDEIGRENTKSMMSERSVNREIQQFKRDMWSRGVNPNDPAWQRQLLSLVEKMLANRPTLNKVGNKIKRGAKIGSGVWKAIKPF